MPGTIHKQLAELEEGHKVFTLARTVVQPATGPELNNAALSVVALGCEMKHAKDIALADSLLQVKIPSVTPIGLACQLCERETCNHRGAPPLGRTLRFDPYRRHAGMFDFSS